FEAVVNPGPEDVPLRRPVEHRAGPRLLGRRGADDAVALTAETQWHAPHLDRATVRQSHDDGVGGGEVGQPCPGPSGMADVPAAIHGKEGEQDRAWPAAPP